MRWNAAHLALLLAALSATAAPARKTVAAKAPPADWQAGTARVDITPKWPLWMAGFAARTRPSEGVVAPVFAKALALEDKTGARFILITADLLGFVDAVSEEVAARVKTRHGIPRERIVFNASHTHWGPVIGRQLQAAYPMTSRQWADVDRYTADLTDQVTELVAEALRKLQPARITYSETTASFASNYRTKTDKGFIHKANPEGVVERLVPVMRVGGEKDAVLAVVFGYACHPTVATGEDRLYDFHGDYPGFAQAQLEREFLGSTAMFIQGFGGDARAEPRGSLALSQRHGTELATQVALAVRAAKTPVTGPIRAAFDRVALEFRQPPERAEWEKRVQSSNASVARNAKVMLAELDARGKIGTEYLYPIQAWRFGGDLTFVAMGGETLVDYAVRFRKELGGVGHLWLAGYSNDVSCYIPPVRVLEEGGYEPDESMIYYARPGPFAPSVEERIVSKTKEVVSRLGK